MQDTQRMIRAYQSEDLEPCARLLILAYNDEPWNNHWTRETASKYLREFAESRSFVGFVACESDTIVGAMFAHVKTWWTNDELFVDELFVQPQKQRRGCGQALLTAAEEYARAQGLAGLTLLTNRHMPAKSFYEKNSYALAEHVVFMYKEFGRER